MKYLGIFTAAIFLFALVSFVFFRIPDGSLIVSGDFYQLPNYVGLLSRYQYAWFNQIGQGSYNPLFISYPYYFALSVLDVFFSPNGIASWILFLFLTTSFFSMWSATFFLIPNLDTYKRRFLSFVYALNSFVVTIFTYGWGYTHHFIIYVFLPLLIATYVSVLVRKEKRGKGWLLFTLVFVASLPAYNNVSFFVLVLLLQLVLTISLLLTRKIALGKELLFTLFKVLLIYLFLMWPVFYPIVDSTINSSSKLFYKQAALGGDNYLEGWITSTSSSFKNVFSFSLDNYRYPFAESSNRLLFILIGCFYFLFLLSLLSLNSDKARKVDSHYKYATTFLLSFTVFCVLAVRFMEPLSGMLKPLYLSPFFIFFRSPEKIFTAIPVLYTLALSFLIDRLPMKTLRAPMVALLFFLLLPFLFQILQQFLVADYNRFAKKQSPEYSYIVSIPSEYADARTLIDSESKSTAVVSLPYSVKNSINWSNYPAWGFVGHDILNAVYAKRFVSANTFDHTSIESTATFKDLSEKSSSAQDLLDAVQKFGGEFVLFHKDIDPALFVKSFRMQEAISQAVSLRALSQIADNKYFTLYQLAPELVQPVLSLNGGSLHFQKINPTQYILDIDVSQKTRLRFLQSFDKNWAVYTLPNSRQSERLSGTTYSYPAFRTIEHVGTQHFMTRDTFTALFSRQLNIIHEPCVDYANCWDIRPSDVGGGGHVRLLLYYRHQTLVYAQLAIVLLTLLTLFMSSLWISRRSGA